MKENRLSIHVVSHTSVAHDRSKQQRFRQTTQYKTQLLHKEEIDIELQFGEQFKVSYCQSIRF